MNLSRASRLISLLLGIGILNAAHGLALAQQQLYDIAVPGRNIADPHETRADFLLAALAAQQSARRESDLGKGTGLVTLAPGAKATFTDRDGQFKLEGFSLLETAINSIGPPKNGGDGQRLFGVVRLIHPSGPGANIGFIVDYLRKGDGIVINELTVLTVTPLKPRVSVLTVPAGELPRIVARASGRFVPVFETVSRVGKPLPLAAAQAKGPTTVVVLGADRLLPGDRLEAKFTDMSGRPVAGLPPAQMSQVGGFVVVAQDFPNGLVPGRVAVTHVTDLHPKATDGRQLLGTVALVGPAAAQPAPTPAPSTPSVAQAAGGWTLDDEANPTQLAFATPERADDPELLMSCDRPNNELHVLYRKLPSDDVDTAADKLGSLEGTLTGGGATLTLPGFVSRAPEATAVGYDILVTDNSIAAFGAPDLKWTLPGMTIATPLPAAAAQFVQACPKASTVTESMTWRRRINLAAGYSVDLPLGLFRLASADRFGRFYRGGPGNGTLQISNVVNQDDLTPREALKRMAQDKDVVTKVTKSAAGKDSLSITGTRGSRAVFLKATLTCERSQWAIVRLEYDPAARSEVEPLVGRIDQSFTPQGAFEGQNACE
jgi:hypothetical protein